MSKHNKFIKEQERLQQEEQKNHPTGTFNDSFNQTQSGMPNTSGMTWKEIGGLILFLLIIFVGYSIYKFFFN
ncbi:DUF6366 family protein [Lysinibacillus endophyticus]|uniref:Phage capsid protein n=1 Tax=Oikeobacillus pervagus TaxID=1325931 RepID=A0AAJ1WKV9_9BACI|nr:MULTISPECIES: DUF6366 family protein [Bacillaceae]MCP1145107.1 DUF6366 family protein [Lysinibacillus endophyticus]MDQ0215551.1 hypothetical protein [Oikeobacillus pervagus]